MCPTSPRCPGIISYLFAKPKMRKYPFRMLLADDKNFADTYPRKPGKLALFVLDENRVISDLKFLDKRTSWTRCSADPTARRRFSYRVPRSGTKLPAWDAGREGGMQTARQIRWFFAGWLCLQSCLAANPTGTIHLIVNCETPGARVYLDRHALGRAGEELAVPYGRDLHLTVRAPRHISETLLLPCLLPGDPVLEIPVDLAPEPAALRITAESPNRMTKISRGCLLLDGQDLGEVYLPFETNDLAPRRPHHQPQRARLQLGRMLGPARS
jgi:hypothetical protein